MSINFNSLSGQTNKFLFKNGNGGNKIQFVSNSSPNPYPEYIGGNTYNIGDIVSFGGSNWICVTYAPPGYGPFGGYLDGSLNGTDYWNEFIPPPEPEDSNVGGLTLAAGLYKKKYEGYFYDQDSFFNSRLVGTLDFTNEGQYFQITNVGTANNQEDWTAWGLIPQSQFDAPEAMTLPFPSVGKGVIYFGFGSIENGGTASVGPVLVSEEVTSQIDDNYSQAAGQNNKSLIIKGYFKPLVNGVYQFRLVSDDASYLWLGTNAFDGNRTMNNSVVSLPGIHGPYPQEGSFTMVANSYYPLTVEFGNGPDGEGVLTFEYMPPGSTEWTSDLAGKLFHDTTAKGHVNQ